MSSLLINGELVGDIEFGNRNPSLKLNRWDKPGEKSLAFICLGLIEIYSMSAAIKFPPPAAGSQIILVESKLFLSTVSDTKAVASSKSVGTIPKWDLFFTKYSWIALVNSSASDELSASSFTPPRLSN